MMNKLLHFSIAALVCSIILTSCTTTGLFHEKPPAYKVISMKEKYYYLESEFSYPEFKSDEYSALNFGIKGFVEDNYRNFKKDIKTNYDNLSKTYGYLTMPYCYDLNARTVTQSGGLTSILFECYFYNAGAPHGNILYKSINYDINKKRPVSITEATGLSEQDISRLVRKELSHLEKEGFLISGTEPGKGHFDNYTLDGKNLTIWFAPYEIAPYSLGCQTAHITLN